MTIIVSMEPCFVCVLRSTIICPHLWFVEWFKKVFALLISSCLCQLRGTVDQSELWRGGLGMSISFSCIATERTDPLLWLSFLIQQLIKSPLWVLYPVGSIQPHSSLWSFLCFMVLRFMKCPFSVTDSDLLWLTPLSFRWWWLPDTLTAPPSPSSSPGFATCFSAPLWVDLRKTTITLPLLPHLHLWKARRSWAKALARGRSRKPSRTSRCSGVNCIRLAPTWRDFPFLSRERGSSMFYQMRPSLLE